VYEWDEGKREASLKKHGYDFADADMVSTASQALQDGAIYLSG